MSEGAVARRRRARVAATGLALLMAATTACSSGGGGGGVAGGGQYGGAGQTTPAPPAAHVVVAPGAGARDVALATPVTVTTPDGTLSSVRLVSPAGKVVKGSLSGDKTSWRSNELLGYAKTYTVTAVAKNAQGTSSQTVSRFSTVTPANLTMPSFGALERGGTFGVGMPVTVHFDEPIPDRATAERSLEISTSPRAVGSWSWIDSQNVHWRPKVSSGHYWKPGTKITVKVKVYGVALGRGLYGQADKSVSFTIGRSQLAIINDATHMMTVYINGKVARKIPVSMGRGGWIRVGGNTIDFWTRSGPHVVLEKYPVKEMSSESYGLPISSPLGYKEKIPLAVRISGGGEFVHAASWSVADQGYQNVSHGCVNISPANADWFYSTFRYGDIVDIRGTARELALTDGLGDWTLSWAQWVKGSALN
ncbi:MAG TPA: Ig-like domain-containing protein [Mycobacteriales bacterium]|nr:Ig-like domain-containing protein [Mycobacteriales bacterium]